MKINEYMDEIGKETNKAKKDKMIFNFYNQYLLPRINKANILLFEGRKFSQNEQFVYDKLIIYDNERDELKEMIGLRAKNTMSLTEKLKEKLSSFYGEEINANNNIYKKVKNIVFKEFKVTKWEEMPVNTYNKVYAFIDNIEDELR